MTDKLSADLANAFAFMEANDLEPEDVTVRLTIHIGKKTLTYDDPLSVGDAIAELEKLVDVAEDEDQEEEAES